VFELRIFVYDSFVKNYRQKLSELVLCWREQVVRGGWVAARLWCSQPGNDPAVDQLAHCHRVMTSKQLWLMHWLVFCPYYYSLLNLLAELIAVFKRYYNNWITSLLLSIILQITSLLALAQSYLSGCLNKLLLWDIAHLCGSVAGVSLSCGNMGLIITWKSPTKFFGLELFADS
jgi:hypothetical protein